jgi:hypothetical protein
MLIELSAQLPAQFTRSVEIDKTIGRGYVRLPDPRVQRDTGGGCHIRSWRYCSNFVNELWGISWAAVGGV